MGVSINFIFRNSPLNKDKSNHNNPLGYVYVQRIENRKTTYRSLRLPKFRREHWDEKKQRVKRNRKIDYETYNSKIEATLKDILDKQGSLRGIDETNDSRSFMDYFKSVLEGTKLKSKHGTRTKYHSVYRKLQGFLEEVDKTDLLFSELDVDLIDDIQAYMDDTGMEKNTIIHYLKIMQTIVRKSMVSRKTMNTYNPFMNYQFEKKSVILKETLNQDEIKKLLKLEVNDARLRKVKNMFLIQFFGGAMRVSDLMTLRFRNLTNGRLQYRMFKTDYPIDIPITSLLAELLSKSVDDLETDIDSYHDIPDIRMPNLVERKEKYFAKLRKADAQSRPTPFLKRSEVLKPENIPVFVFLEKSDFQRLPYYSKMLRSPVELYVDAFPYSMLCSLQSSVKSYLDSKGERVLHDSGASKFAWKDGLFEKKSPHVTVLLKLIEKRIKKIEDKFYQDVLNELTELGTSNETKNNFVFGKLKEEDFQSVLDNESFQRANENQYKKITRAGIVYNRNLKELQVISGIDKRFHSHLPRISFTNIMMRGKHNPRDISDVLAHQSLATTSVYMKSGFKDGRVDSVINDASKDYE